ncbi:hypothetical protein [Chishuiella changwenlii]|uniref:hypothetical protein n=1 Tax=Chishuiella changwenlii TaxID=1434701 RepID=UPI002FD9552F
MKKLVSFIATLAAPFAIEAQDSILEKKDSLSFIKSKRMSDRDLAKKEKEHLSQVYLIFLQIQ